MAWRAAAAAIAVVERLNGQEPEMRNPGSENLIDRLGAFEPLQE